MSEPLLEHLKCNKVDDVLVVTITAQQMQGDDLADDLRRELFAAADHFQADKIVLDFQNVKYLGSAGFRPLLSLHRRLRGSNGAMLLCNLAPEVAEVFHITRLVSTSRSSSAPFESAPNVTDAVTRLKQRAASTA